MLPIEHLIYATVLVSILQLVVLTGSSSIRTPQPSLSSYIHFTPCFSNDTNNLSGYRYTPQSSSFPTPPSSWCYSLHIASPTQKLSWYDARHSCENWNSEASLSTIHSLSFEHFIRDHWIKNTLIPSIDSSTYTTVDIWIGLHTIERSQISPRWDDGSLVGQATDFENFDGPWSSLTSAHPQCVALRFDTHTQLSKWIIKSCHDTSTINLAGLCQLRTCASGSSFSSPGEPFTCNSRGTCQFENPARTVQGTSCNCDQGYITLNPSNPCSSWKCNSINHDSSNVCSSRGNCLTPDHCSCWAGYAGASCEQECLAGSYRSEATAESSWTQHCLPCPPGYYCDQDHMEWNQLKSCPLEFTSLLGSTSLDNCTINRYNCSGHGTLDHEGLCICDYDHFGSLCNNNCSQIFDSSSYVSMGFEWKGSSMETEISFTRNENSFTVATLEDASVNQIQNFSNILHLRSSSVHSNCTHHLNSIGEWSQFRSCALNTEALENAFQLRHTGCYSHIYYSFPSNEDQKHGSGLFKFWHFDRSNGFTPRSVDSAFISYNVSKTDLKSKAYFLNQTISTTSSVIINSDSSKISVPQFYQLAEIKCCSFAEDAYEDRLNISIVYDKSFNMTLKRVHLSCVNCSDYVDFQNSTLPLDDIGIFEYEEFNTFFPLLNCSLKTTRVLGDFTKERLSFCCSLHLLPSYNYTLNVEFSLNDAHRVFDTHIENRMFFGRSSSQTGINVGVLAVVIVVAVVGSVLAGAGGVTIISAGTIVAGGTVSAKMVGSTSAPAGISVAPAGILGVISRIPSPFIALRKASSNQKTPNNIQSELLDLRFQAVHPNIDAPHEKRDLSSILHDLRPSKYTPYVHCKECFLQQYTKSSNGNAKNKIQPIDDNDLSHIQQCVMCRLPLIRYLKLDDEDRFCIVCALMNRYITTSHGSHFRCLLHPATKQKKQGAIYVLYKTAFSVSNAHRKRKSSAKTKNLDVLLEQDVWVLNSVLRFEYLYIIQSLVDSSRTSFLNSATVQSAIDSCESKIKSIHADMLTKSDALPRHLTSLINVDEISKQTIDEFMTLMRTNLEELLLVLKHHKTCIDNPSSMQTDSSILSQSSTDPPRTRLTEVHQSFSSIAPTPQGNSSSQNLRAMPPYPSFFVPVPLSTGASIEFPLKRKRSYGSSEDLANQAKGEQPNNDVNPHSKKRRTFHSDSSFNDYLEQNNDSKLSPLFGEVSEEASFAADSLPTVHSIHDSTPPIHATQDDDQHEFSMFSPEDSFDLPFFMSHEEMEMHSWNE